MDFLYSPYISLFLITAFGLALGKISINGISLGISSILIVALFFGHNGIVIPTEFKQIGLILFVYSVGIQAGPGFFESFNKKSLPVLVVALIVLFSGAFVAYLTGYVFGFESSYISGLFAGSLTSSAGLASAASAGDGNMASVAFAIVFPIGVLAVILYISLSPKIFGFSIEAEEREYMDKMKLKNPDIKIQNYQVENKNLFGKTIAESDIRNISGGSIIRIKKGNDTITANANIILNEGDIVKVSGTQKVHETIALLIGSKSDVSIPMGNKFVTRNMIITNKKAINQTLGNLGLNSHYDAIVTHIRRSGIDIIPKVHVKLRYGDKITVTSMTSKMDEIIQRLGDTKSKINDIDFLPISIGILIGILLGSISIPLGVMNIKLGFTGGVLISGLILSRIGKTGRIVWNIAGAQNQFIRKLGLIFFLAAVGTNAGQHLSPALSISGIELLISGMLIAVVPMTLGILIGRFVFKMNFLTILGTLTGAMTSTPGLSAIESMTQSNAARIAYASTYPIALVLIIIVSRFLTML